MNMYKDMVNQLIRGMNWIDASYHEFANKELHKIVVDVWIGGEWDEGYYVFQYSFDDEVSILEDWAEEMNILTPFDVPKLGLTLEMLYESKWDSVHKIVKGFQDMRIALGRLSALNKIDSNLRNILCQEGSAMKYNPFQQYGIEKFEVSLAKWQQAFLQELQEQIGKHFMKKKTKEVSNLYFEQVEYGQRLLFDPVTMQEEKNRIQLVDEENGTQIEWHEKNQLQSISEEEYEKWYKESVIRKKFANEIKKRES